MIEFKLKVYGAVIKSPSGDIFPIRYLLTEAEFHALKKAKLIPRSTSVITSFESRVEMLQGVNDFNVFKAFGGTTQ
jgi:hypothetical protein